MYDGAYIIAPGISLYVLIRCAPSNAFKECFWLLLTFIRTHAFDIMKRILIWQLHLLHNWNKRFLVTAIAADIRHWRHASSCLLYLLDEVVNVDSACIVNTDILFL